MLNGSKCSVGSPPCMSIMWVPTRRTVSKRKWTSCALGDPFGSPGNRRFGFKPSIGLRFGSPASKPGPLIRGNRTTLPRIVSGSSDRHSRLAASIGGYSAPCIPAKSTRQAPDIRPLTRTTGRVQVAAGVSRIATRPRTFSPAAATSVPTFRDGTRTDLALASPPTLQFRSRPSLPSRRLATIYCGCRAVEQKTKGAPRMAAVTSPAVRTDDRLEFVEYRQRTSEFIPLYEPVVTEEMRQADLRGYDEKLWIRGSRTWESQGKKFEEEVCRFIGCD